MKRFYAGNKQVVIFVIILVAVAAAIIAAVRVSRQGLKGSGLSSEYQLDLSSMAYIDPELIIYEQITEPIPTGLSESRSLTVDASGIIYAAGDQGINVIDPQGRIKETFTLAVAPRCLALVEEQIYIGAQDKVVVADRNGNIQATWPSLGDNALITSIALDNEHVYIADAGQKIVWCYNRRGQFIRRIGDKDPRKDVPGFVIYKPFLDLAIGPEGLLWVVNPGRYQLEAYTAEGEREFAWGQFGNNLDDFTSCCNPVNFAILSDGSFVTCEKGIPRVKLYDPSGIMIGVVAGPQQIMGETWLLGETPEQGNLVILDVAVDAAEHIYILERSRNLVMIFARKKANR